MTENPIIIEITSIRSFSDNNKIRKERFKPGKEKEKSFLYFFQPTKCYAKIGSNNLEKSRIKVSVVDNGNKSEDGSCSQPKAKKAKIMEDNDDSVTGLPPDSVDLTTRSDATGLTYKFYYEDKPAYVRYEKGVYEGIKTKGKQKPRIGKEILNIQLLIEEGEEGYVQKVKNKARNRKLKDKKNLTREFAKNLLEKYNGHKLKGHTLVQIAAYHNRHEILPFLIEEKEIDVNHQRENGSTALHEAIFHGHFESVEYLLKQKNMQCDLYRETNSGYIPLHNAFRKQRNVDICKFDEKLVNLLIDEYYERWKKKGQGDPTKLYEKLKVGPNSSHFKPFMQKELEMLLKKRLLD
eukprot:g3844.t1